MKNNKINTTKKIADIVLTVVIILLAVIIAVSVYAKSSGKQMVFKYSVTWVLSESMEPEIPERSYILIKKIDAKDVKENDVIAFISRDPAIQGNLNTHRVIEIIGDNEQFVTKGDHNAIKDNYPVYAEDVVAKYVCNLKLLTFFGRLFATKLGLILTLILLAFCIIAWFFIVIKKERKETKEAEIEKLVKQEVERLEQAAKQQEQNNTDNKPF